MNRAPCRPGVSRLALFFLAAAAPVLWGEPAEPANLSIDWKRELAVLQTTPSLQVVVNPLLLRDSPIHDAVFKSVREMGADYVRYVPWLPYPKLAVAELEPPAGGKTSWDFSLIDPTLVDFMQANCDHPAMINFSTIPAWLFQTDQPVTYPPDPKQVCWNYTQGTELRPGGLKELGDYYARLVGWYVNGGFVDENGRQHVSGHHFKIPYWEVFNEPDLEHHMTPQQYTERYDAVVLAVRPVSPTTKFVGISVALPSLDPAMFEYFLNPANHQPGVPLDMISYHFYALVDPGEAATHWQYTFFDQADRFIATIRYIESIRRRLSPGTKVALNEVGAILPEDRNAKTRDLGVDPAIPPEYWNAASALFAYIYVEAAKLGIDVVSVSQLVGFPTQYPSVTMLDWKTGEPNARFWSLKLLRDNFAPGDKLITTPRKEKYPDVLAQAFASSRGRKLLLINKRDHPSTVHLGEPAAGISLESVDPTTGPGITRVERWSGAEIKLPPFAVTVLNYGP